MAEAVKKRGVNMTSGVIWKQLVMFAIPIVVGNLFQQFYNTVDAVVVGRYVGKAALAAVGSTTPIINVLVGIFTGLSTGATVVLSQYYGAKDRKGIHDTVHTTVAMTVCCGIVFAVLGIILTNPLLRLMKTPDDVFIEESAYLKIYFGGIISLMLYNMGSGLLRAVGDSKRPLYYLVFCSILNILLDLLFVIVFRMGVRGVAIATIISQLVSGILILITIIRTQEDYRYIFKDTKIHGDIFRPIIKIGIPAAIQLSVMGFSNILVQSYINVFGTDVMAAWSAQMKLQNFCLLPAQSLSVAATTFVAQNVGADQYERAEKGCNTTILMGLGMQVVLIGIVIIFRFQLLRIFNSDPSVIQYGSTLIERISPFCVCSCIMNCIGGAIRGSGDSKMTTMVTLGTNVVFRQLYLIIVSRISNTLGIVSMAFPFAWALGAIIMVLYFRTGKWKEKSIVKRKK